LLPNMVAPTVAMSGSITAAWAVVIARGIDAIFEADRAALLVIDGGPNAVMNGTVVVDKALPDKKGS